MDRPGGHNYTRMKKKYSFCDTNPSSIKCVLVGDPGVGKSNVAIRISGRDFKSEYNPTVFDNYAATVMLDERPFHFSLFDTAGKDDYDRLRVISYMNCDVFLVCFSVADPASLKSVEGHWVPELRHYLPTTPFIVVGTCADLRDEMPDDRTAPEAFVSFKEGLGVADSIGAVSYVECSSLTGEGMQDVTRDAIETVMKAGTYCRKTKLHCCGCSLV